jgi:hypothetical protein
MSAAQHRLFNELAESGRANTLQEHSRIAVEALKAGGRGWIARFSGKQKSHM